MSKIKKWLCLDCGSSYTSPLNAKPFVVGWDDGHICAPILYAEVDKKNAKKCKFKKKDKIWTTFYN